jgi:antitoxin VapB
MSLNIKNEETHRLAQELADLTGQSMSAAVNEAIREKLQRIKGKSVADQIMKIAKETGRLWKEPYKSIDHGDLLYDEKGLPK